MTTFAARLRRKRKAEHLSQVALAAELGVDQKMISKYENGHDLPRPDKYEAFSKFLEMDRADLEILLYLERNAAGVRQPRDPGGVVPGIDALIAKRLDDVERRLSALEQPGGARPPRSAQAAPRKPSPK